MGSVISIECLAPFSQPTKRKRRQTTEKGIQALIIGLALVALLLVGCSYRMVPNETKIEYGTTETDSKNSKLQEKKFITQTWKWH